MPDEDMRETVAWKLALISILAMSAARMTSDSDSYRDEMLKNADTFMEGLRVSGYEIVPIASATA